MVVYSVCDSNSFKFCTEWMQQRERVCNCIPNCELSIKWIINSPFHHILFLFYMHSKRPKKILFLFFCAKENNIITRNSWK